MIHILRRSDEPFSASHIANRPIQPTLRHVVQTAARRSARNKTRWAYQLCSCGKRHSFVDDKGNTRRVGRCA